MKKTIAIVGAGIGGLAAGCYAQLKGYSTHIFESHSVPGGVCTAWKRKGYTFDGCIHHLPGMVPGTKFYGMWEELGIMPGLDVLYNEELVQVEGPGGKKLTVYTDLDKLADHAVLTAPPSDAPLLARWVMAMRSSAGSDLTEIVLASPLEKLKMLKRLPDLLTWGKYTLEGFAGKRLTDPFLKRAFPTILYDTPSNPLILQMNLLAGCSTGSYGWPAGGSLAFARTVERRFEELGGSIHYKTRVDKVIVENDRAVGLLQT
ncbi:MAG: phytoene desaturase family protein, partial [Candidatus Geothermincolia bacterium]